MGINILLLSCAAGFSAMRVFVLFDRSIPLFTMTLALGLIHPAISLYIFTQSVPCFISLSPDLRSCSFDLSLDMSTYRQLLVFARAAAIATDLIVLVLTCMRTAYTLKMTRGLTKTPIATAMLLNGMQYFASMLVANAVGLVLVGTLYYLVMMSMWIAMLTSVMTCRFMLDLREAGSVHMYGPMAAQGVLTSFGAVPGFAIDCEPSSAHEQLPEDTRTCRSINEP